MLRLGTAFNSGTTPSEAFLKLLFCLVWVDAGYRGKVLNAWVANLKQTDKIRLDVREKPRPGFTLLKHRWVVERTFAWLGNYRIHAKDYEILTDNSQAFIHIVMIHLLLKRKNKKRVLKRLLRSEKPLSR